MWSDFRVKYKILGSLVLTLCVMCWGPAQASDAMLEGTDHSSADVFESKDPGMEFSIRIPPLWQAEVGTQRFAVTLKPTAKADRLKLPNGVIADPSITVAVAKKPVSFDQESLQRIGQEIEDNFVRYNGSGTNFQIFQKNILNDLPNMKSALLYYVSFQTEGTEAGQAILVAGNERVRYRVTLSDHRLNFDKNLELFYPYMTSLKFPVEAGSVDSNQSSSLEQWALWGVIGISSVVGFIFVIRARRSRLGFDGTTAQESVSQAPLSDASSMSSPGIPSLGSVVGTNALSNDGRVAPPALSEIDSLSEEEVPAFSIQADSMIGVRAGVAENSVVSDAGLPTFSDRDLSAPPESVPLSQLVTEEYTASGMKKRWQFFLRKKKD